jgi:hypothetical protein
MHMHMYMYMCMYMHMYMHMLSCVVCNRAGSAVVCIDFTVAI